MSKYNRDRGLSGLNPLAYMGVEPTTPPQLVQELRSPTQNDYIGYTIGTIWLVKGTEEIWMLVDKNNQIANWTLTTSGDLTFQTDDGNTAHPALGIINVVGGVNIDTSSIPNNGNNVIVALQDNIVVAGTVQFTSLPSGLLLTDVTGLISASNGANGQVLIGGSAQPIWNTITSGDGSITFTPGANTLDMVIAPGFAGFAGLIADDTNIAAPNIANRVIVAGGVGIDTTSTVLNTLTVGVERSAANGQILIGGGAGADTAWGAITSTGGSVVITHPAANTINLESIFIGLKDGAATNVVPAAGRITIASGTMITSLASANTITVGITDAGVVATPQMVYSPAAGGAASWGRLAAGAGITVVDVGGVVTITAVGGAAGGINTVHTDGADASEDGTDTSITIVGANVVETSGAVHTVTVGLTQGTDGQVILGATGAAPIWASLTAGAGITLTPAANALTIASTGGFSGLLDDATNPADPTVGGRINLIGGVLLNSVATANTITVNLDYPNADGKVLISSAAAGIPAWASLTSTGGTITVTPGANTINLEAGTSFGGLKDDAAAIAAPDGAKCVTVYGDARATASVDTCTLSSIKTGANEITVALDYPTGNVLDDGKILIASQTGAPIWTRITGSASVIVTPNHNSITLTAPGGGGGAGIQVLDCISGTATPAVLTPTLIYIEGDANPGGACGGYDNITTIGTTDLVEIKLKPAVSFPATTAWNSGVIYMGGIGAAGGANRMMHRYGTYNTFYGLNSGNLTLSLANATRNTGIGQNALNSLVGTNANEACQNTAVGAYSLDSCTSGSYNTAIGRSALTTSTTANNNTAVGCNALFASTTATSNTAIGMGTMQYINTGSYNTAIGHLAMFDATTAAQNVAIGYGCCTNLTTLNGSNNVAIGYQALTTGTTSGYNVAIGHSSLSSLTTTDSNVAIGYLSMNASTTSASTVGIGTSVLKNATSASYTVAIGDNSFGSGATTGDCNVAVGWRTLYSATTATRNVAIGSGSTVGGEYAPMQLATTAHENVAIGDGSLGKLVSGGSNVSIGHNAGTALTGAESSNVLINSSGVVGESDTIRIGANTACYLGGVYNKAVGPTPWPAMCGSDGKIATGVGYSPYAPGGVVLAARLINDVSNVTGDTTQYYLGTAVGGVVKPLTSAINKGGGTYTAGGIGTPAQFTAPVGGAYLLTMNIRLNGIRAAIIPPPPPPPVYSRDPIAIETTGGTYAYYPTLMWNKYQGYESSSFSTVAYLAANDTVKWYIQIDYRPGDNNDYTQTGRVKCIGIDGYDGGSIYFTYVGVTLLHAY